MELENRRKYPRYSISVDATMKIQEELIPCITTDISAEGIGIESNKSIPLGNRVNISIYIPDEVVMVSTAVWSVHKVLDDQNAYRTGFKIHNIVHQEIAYKNIDELENIVQKIASEVDSQCTHRMTG